MSLAGMNVTVAVKRLTHAADLPVAAIRLEADKVEVLKGLGLRRVGQIMDKPRGPLARRIGAAALDRLDLALWTMTEDSFLPHGLQGGAQDADQPVLLGSGPISNGANTLVLLDKADTTPAEAAPLDRIWVLFDAADETAMTKIGRASCRERVSSPV